VSARLLITGSRTWTDRETCYWVLYNAWDNLGRDVTLIHGGAEGADNICQSIWLESGLPEEMHRPIWYSGGVYDWRAGFARNDKMVQRGADAALAFDLPCTSPRCRRTEPHVTHGTEDCLLRIEAAGIPLWRWSLSPK